MPQRNNHETRFASLFATYLNPTFPATIESLCRDIECRPPALMRASATLLGMGVRTNLTDDGWTADPATWRKCQTVAHDFAETMERLRESRQKGRAA